MVASSPTIHQPLVAKPKTISNHNLLDFSAFLENTSFPVRQKKAGKNTEILHHRKYYLVSWKKKSKEIRAFQVWLFLAVVRTFVDKTRYLPSTRKRQKIKLFLCLFSLSSTLSISSVNGSKSKTVKLLTLATQPKTASAKATVRE